MTGFGMARVTENVMTATVEVRSVNNRHLKVTVRGSDPYPALESEFEKLVRQSARRGTVSVHVRVERPNATGPLKIDSAIVSSYLAQLEPIAAALPPAAAAALYSGVLQLPGVTSEDLTPQSVPDVEWKLVEQATLAALEGLTKTRSTEGEQMVAELRSLIRQIVDRTGQIRDHLPQVIEDFRKRLRERVTLALAAAGATVDESNLVREIALYADRTDVAEELTRIAGHLAAVDDVLRVGGKGAGRRLEFLAQELGREANTLGSKAGDAVISRHAIEIKAVLEKFRELVLNIE
ncbi:MAG: YicC/YloC family endoribonuclease [Gemmataceae bacterium]